MNVLLYLLSVWIYIGKNSICSRERALHAHKVLEQIEIGGKTCSLIIWSVPSQPPIVKYRTEGVPETLIRRWKSFLIYSELC